MVAPFAPPVPLNDALLLPGDTPVNASCVAPSVFTEPALPAALVQFEAMLATIVKS
jgi:hypothetical protein